MSKVTQTCLAKRYIYSMLENYLEYVDEKNNIVRYRYDFSDKKIFKKIKERLPEASISIDTVRGIRARSWGSLYKPMTLMEKFELLEKECNKLKRENKKLSTQLQQLEQPGVGTTPDLFEEPQKNTLHLNFDKDK